MPSSKSIAALLVAGFVALLLLAQFHVTQAHPAGGGIIINEIHADPDPDDGDANGDGSADTTDDEFVELVNQTGTDLDIGGWSVSDAVNTRHVFPTGATLPDGCAVVIFGGGTPASGGFGNALAQTASSGALGLNNSGDTVTLRDADGAVVAEVTYPNEGNINQSLTRDPDLTGGFVLHTTATGSGGALFSPGVQVDGAAFGSNCLRADLALSKGGPATVPSGVVIEYAIELANNGAAPAPSVILTDTLPAGLTYLSDTSGITPSQPNPGTLVWSLGTLAPGDGHTFTLSAVPDSAVRGAVVNTAVASTAASESSNANNTDEHTTIVGDSVLINAVHHHAYQVDDEALQLINVGPDPVALGGWRVINDNGTALEIPSGVSLAPGATVWLTKENAAFARQFGFSADYDMTTLDGSWPSLANDGEALTVRDASNGIVDVLVYGDADTAVTGWTGPALQAYRGSSFATTGQVLYRKLDQHTGLPVMDDNSAESWAQSTGDIINGRKVRYPGWDLNAFFFTEAITESASLTIAIAPDNAFDTVKAHIDGAQESIQMESLIFTNLALMQALADAAARGVAVDVLLEGAPAGGLLDQERYLCQLLDDAGGQCWFIINETDQEIYDRYKFMHAKFMVIDGETALISSENMTGSSLPYDDKADGTFGRRGVVLITDATGVVERLEAILAADLDPVNHVDVLPWTRNHPIYGNKYGSPPPGFIPDDESGGMTYTVRYPVAATFTGTFAFEVVQSPENSVRSADSMIGLVNQAGAGDTVLVQQLNERPYWGSPSMSNAIDDPNPRLEAYLDAARRGARVRIMLDEYHLIEYYSDDPADNAATCAAIKAIAIAEALNIDCTLANPTGLGVHNKMVLVEVDGRGTIHVGSVNGTEQASKGNREVALQVQSNEAYALLADMFERDWPHRLALPVVMNGFIGRTDHVVISELFYNPPGNPDDAEFVELANPTAYPVDLSGFTLGDATARDDFEDMRIFPPGTVLQPNAALVVTIRADAFFAEFGRLPDFEILDSDPTVPELIDDLTWGDPGTYLQFGNLGDEVWLRDAIGVTVDAIAYGSGAIEGVAACDLVTISGRALARDPFWRDTDSCSADFAIDAVPSPGVLP